MSSPNMHPIALRTRMHTNYVCLRIQYKGLYYRTGALLGACAYTSTGKKYALIREMCLIKSAFLNAGILRTATKLICA